MSTRGRKEGTERESASERDVCTIDQNETNVFNKNKNCREIVRQKDENSSECKY